MSKRSNPDVAMGLGVLAAVGLTFSDVPTWFPVVLLAWSGLWLIWTQRRWTLDVLGGLFLRPRCSECERRMWRRPARAAEIDHRVYRWCSEDCWTSGEAWRLWLYRNRATITAHEGTVMIHHVRKDDR